jgi:glycosyltransferase involved in cell wall biosynthesis
MSGGLVSLVMPVWRPRTEWLRQAVQAALDQRGCEIELLVIDDGSPDPIAGLLFDFEDSRLRVQRIEHGGASYAKNAGIAEARGDFFRFIDADDEIEPDSTANLLALSEGGPTVIAYGATLFCDEQLRPLWTMTSQVQGDAVTACLLGRFTVRPHALLFPRSVVDATGGWSTEISVSEDWDYILRSLEHAPVRGTSSIATRYRRHPGGLTSDPAEAERGAQAVVDRYFDRHPEQRGSSLERRARARLLAHFGRVYATHGRIGKGAGQLARAARLDPTAIAMEIWQARRRVGSIVRRRVLGTSPANREARPAP